MKAQTFNIEFDSIFETGIFKPSELILFGNDKVYFCKNRLNENLIIQNLNNNETILVPKLTSSNKNIESISLKNDKLLINLFQKSFFYSVKNSKANLIDSIIHTYDKSEIIDSNKILFYKNYIYDKVTCPKEDRTKFGIYEIKSKSFLKEKSIDFKYIYFTYLINNFIDFSPDRSKFLLAQTYPYKIDIYDSNINLNQTLLSQLSQEPDKLDSLLELEEDLSSKNNSVKNIIGIISKEDNKLNRIIKSYFVDDSTIIVIRKMSLTNTNKEERNIDVWRFSKGEWHIIVNDQSYFSSWFDTQNKAVKLYAPFKQSERLIFNNGYIYVVGVYFPFNEFKTFDDLVNYASKVDYENVQHGIVRFKYEFK